MNGIDWAGLLHVGLHELQLTPDAFWKLTPLELRLMRGAEAVAPPLSRARLEELAKSFPDKQREMGNDPNRRPARAGECP